MTANRVATHNTPASGWPAALSLELAHWQGRTRLVDASHRGPLRIQRPFYPEGDACHLYLLHPPGGLVAGDSLDIQVRLGPGSHGLLTTPAAGKIYCSNRLGQQQRQQVNLEVQDGATLEWLPQEAIVFDGANAKQDTCIRLHGDARAIAWELVCLGRPAGRQPFVSGQLTQQLAVWRDQTPLLLERTPLKAGPMLDAPWGLQGASVLGTLVATTDDSEALLDELRQQARFAPLAFTRLPGLLLARYLGQCAEQGRNLFMDLWQALRPRLLGREACRPRIWNT